MKRSNLLIMFVRYPRLAAVKTRMTNPQYSPFPLTSEATLALYEAFLKDLLPRFRNTNDFDLWVMLGGATAEEMVHFRNRFSLQKSQLAQMPETPTDLGTLMEHCFAQGFQTGYQRIVLMGSDAPQLSQVRIQEAFQSLEQVEMVIGPDKGGGMYLVGYAAPLAIMEGGIVWSQGTDQEAVIQRCLAQSIAYHLLPEEIDLDTSDDLRCWYQQQHQQCSHTFALVQKFLERE